jgi:four helix bundle protein
MLLGEFRKLEVWQRAHALTLALYRATARFPREELYSLTSQMRRSAVSIPANLAEGTGRQTDADLRRFIRISLGSASELEYHLLLAHVLRLLDSAAFGDLSAQLHSIRGMLVFLMRALNGTRKTRDP